MKHLIPLILSLAVTPLAAIEYGAQSMVASMKSVLVKAPDPAFSQADPALWHYTSRPNLRKAREEHAAFVKLLKEEGVEVVYHSDELPGLADALFVHDPVLITKKGAVLLSMGKELRQKEVDAIGARLTELDIPILGRLTDGATAEGGDTFWLDENTLLVGRGYRTNDKGIAQLQEILRPLDVDVVAFDLSHADGPEACLHLQSVISQVDEKLVVVYMQLAPTRLVQLLQERGYAILELPESEYLTMGSNILAIRPGVVVTIQGNPRIKSMMERAGVRVLTYKGNEISLKAEGGATCLTRPLERVPGA